MRRVETMKVLNVILAVAFLGAVYLVRLDSLLVGALLTSMALSLVSLLPRIRHLFIRSSALLITLLMFFYFYRFFSAVPLFDSTWYLQSQYIPVWVVLFAGFASMLNLSVNCCELKKELELPDEVQLKTWIKTLRSRREEPGAVS